MTNFVIVGTRISGILNKLRDNKDLYWFEEEEVFSGIRRMFGYQNTTFYYDYLLPDDVIVRNIGNGLEHINIEYTK